MAQGVLPFHIEAEKTDSGMTAFAGLPLYLDLAHAIGIRGTIEQHVHARPGDQGYTDAQVILSLILLNLVGGESVDDIAILENDPGLGRLIRHVEYSGKTRGERRTLEKQWRKKRTRALPSSTTIFRYLKTFHDLDQEIVREQVRSEEKAFIPASKRHLKGLYRVNRSFLEFAQQHQPHQTATMDMDATIVETRKDQALFCYKGFPAYQPLNTYWSEHGLLVHSEFRDGNVPAGYQQKRVLEEALELLPKSVERVNLRSDTAGYQWDMLRYCAEGKNDRFGVISFAVGVDVTPEFRCAVKMVPHKDWSPLCREVNGTMRETNQEYAEVVFVPNGTGTSKKGPSYRFVAIRELMPEQLTLPGVEPSRQLSLPFPTVELEHEGDMRRYKLHGIVTNCHDLSGSDIIKWYRDRCGKSEEVHHVMKSELAGGRFPSGEFGSNAAWWAIMILAYNLYALMNHVILGGHWITRRLKAVRYAIINVAGRVIEQARMLRIRLTAEGDRLSLFLRVREKILALMEQPG